MPQRRKKMETKELDFEWHALLRLPPSKAKILDEIIDSQFVAPAVDGKDGDNVEEEMMDSSEEITKKQQLFIEPGESVLAIKFEKNLRRGQFRIKEELVGFSIRDLPCIVETYKTHNNIDLYKVADVSQILLCNDDENVPPMDANEIENLNELASARVTRLKLSRCQHGITGPMKNVTKRRFRKTKKTKFIDAPQIEQQLRAIFRRDVEANKIEFQLVDDDEETRLDSEENPVLPIYENANPFRRPIIISEPLTVTINVTQSTLQEGQSGQPIIEGQPGQSHPTVEGQSTTAEFQLSQSVVEEGQFGQSELTVEDQSITVEGQTIQSHPAIEDQSILEGQSTTAEFQFSQSTTVKGQSPPAECELGQTIAVEEGQSDPTIESQSTTVQDQLGYSHSTVEDRSILEGQSTTVEEGQSVPPVEDQSTTTAEALPSSTNGAELPSMTENESTAAEALLY